MPLIDLNGLGYFKGKENAMIADTYSASKTYAVGDYVYYSGTLYKCKTAISTAEAWTAAHWEAAKLADDVDDLKNATNHHLLSEDTKQAILNCFNHVAWIDEHGQDYYTDLYNAIYNLNGITAIDAVFTQGNYTIFSNAALDSLKKFLVVTATYEDNSTDTIPDNVYSLSGTLATGTSTITVTVGTHTDTFSVTVTEFDVPEGYTRYDYIATKSNSRVQQAPGKFIKLPDQTDMNALSMELRMAVRVRSTSSYDLIGVRNDTSFDNSYSVYINADSSLYGKARGITWHSIYPSGDESTPIALDTPFILKVDNPSTSPYIVSVDDVCTKSFDWDSTFTIPHGMFLFGNMQYNRSTNFNMEPWASLGDIVLRKADGECVGYYVPTVYSGKIGVYDIVTETFYTASTASAVTVNDSGCLYNVGNWV